MRRPASYCSLLSLGVALLGCNNSKEIIESAPFVYQGVIRDEATNIQLAGASIEISGLVVEKSDEDGRYSVPLSFSTDVGLEVTFRKDGYRSKAFLFPRDGEPDKDNERIFRLDVWMTKE